MLKQDLEFRKLPYFFDLYSLNYYLRICVHLFKILIKRVNNKNFHLPMGSDKFKPIPHTNQYKNHAYYVQLNNLVSIYTDAFWRFLLLP